MEAARRVKAAAGVTGAVRAQAAVDRAVTGALAVALAAPGRGPGLAARSRVEAPGLGAPGRAAGMAARVPVASVPAARALGVAASAGALIEMDPRAVRASAPAAGGGGGYGGRGGGRDRDGGRDSGSRDSGGERFGDRGPRREGGSRGFGVPLWRLWLGWFGLGGGPRRTGGDRFGDRDRPARAPYRDRPSGDRPSYGDGDGGERRPARYDREGGSRRRP